MSKYQKLKGLIAAPFVPLNTDGSVNLELIERYYELLESNGIAGAFINGTTGEGASLSQKEKMKITDKWAHIDRGRKSLKIINLVGGTSYQECIENAIHSYESGIFAVAVIAPYFFRPASIMELAEFCAIIGEAVPEMPVYYYHFPAVTGVNFRMIDFLQKVSEYVPNFAGIKYTHENFMDFLYCLDYNKGEYNMLWGRDECMLSALAIGTRGFVGSTYNYAAPLYHKIISCFDENMIDEARSLQMKSVKMILLMEKYGGIAAGKAYMKYIGLDCGKFRLPVHNMSGETYHKFISEVEKSDFNEFLSFC